MARGGKIQIDFMAKATDKVSATMKKVNSSVKGTGKEAGAAAGKMGKLNVAMAAIAAAAVVAGKKLLDLANETAAYGDNVAKTSTRIGVSVEEFQRLDHALKISGSSMEQQKGSFIRLARVADDANSGLKTARDAFDRLGVSVTDADGILKNQPQLLAEVADAFARTADGTEKTALAAELFGRKGTDMLQFLNLGAEGIRKLGDEAEALGAVMSTEAARAAEKYTDSLTRLDASFEGVKRTIGSAVMPILTSLTDELTGVVKFWMNLGSTAEVETEKIAAATARNLGRTTAAIDAVSKSLSRLASGYRTSAKIAAITTEMEAAIAGARAKATRATINDRAEMQRVEEKQYKGWQEEKARIASRIADKEAAATRAEIESIRAVFGARIREAGEAEKLQRAVMDQQIRLAKGATQAQLALADAENQLAEARKSGASDEEIKSLQGLVLHIASTTKKRRSGTRAVRDNTAAVIKNIEAQRASARATLDTARAELELAKTPEGFARQRAALEMEISKIRKAARATELEDVEAEDDRKLALAYQLKTKEIELERLTEDRKTEIQQEANDRREANNKKSLDKMRDQQSASLALFEQTSAKAAGELGGMNKQLGATAGAVGKTAAQWQQYSTGQAQIGRAVAGTAAAIGAASTAFVDGEREKAGILSAMHTAQAIVLAFTPFGQAAAVAHAAAAAMFFGIATGAIKSASPGGGGGGGGVDAQDTGASAGFTGGGEGGEGRSINVTFGGGIVLGRPSDVAQAIAQAEFAARGQGRMGGGI